MYTINFIEAIYIILFTIHWTSTHSRLESFWRTPSEKMNWRQHQWMWNWGNSNILLNYSNETKFILLTFEFIWTYLLRKKKKLKDRSFIFISKPSADISNFGNGGSRQEGNKKKLREYWINMTSDEFNFLQVYFQSN